MTIAIAEPPVAVAEPIVAIVETPVAVAEPEKIEVVKVPRRKILSIPAYTDEVTAFCPKCMTMETLYFSEEGLMPTRKFHQEGKKVFHDCGAQEPCRLFRII